MSEDTAPSDGELDALRERITKLDDEIIRLIGERRGLAVEIGRVKHDMGLPVLDPAREARVVRRVAASARELGVDPELARDVIWRIISAARQAQSGDPSRGGSVGQGATDSSSTGDSSDR